MLLSEVRQTGTASFRCRQIPENEDNSESEESLSDNDADDDTSDEDEGDKLSPHRGDLVSFFTLSLV